MISMIAAMSLNRVIGKNNQLLWNIKEDMKHFVKMTKGKTVVMGRKTYESIGKPLPNRRNIVLSNNPDFKPEGVEVMTFEDALKLGDITVIGGGQTYRQFLPHAETIYLTVFNINAVGDTYFPLLFERTWKITNVVKGQDLRIKFKTYKRRNNFLELHIDTINRAKALL